MTKDAQLRTVLDGVAKDLVRVNVDGGFGIVALPQLYPGGDSVTVRVRKDDDQFFVDDMGLGYRSAEMLGGPTVFGRLAPRVAKLHGVSFDGVMMFGAQVSRDWLPNVILFVATASRRCVEMTAERMSEDVEHSLKVELQRRIEVIYPGRVARDVEIAGRSSRSRQFAVSVDLEGRRSLFDLVTPHHVSINSAIVKFQDVSQLENAPTRVAVLSSRARTDAADVSLLAQWTNSIIGADAETEVIARAA